MGKRFSAATGSPSATDLSKAGTSWGDRGGVGDSFGMKIRPK